MSGDRISVDPKAMMGKPVIVGTRVTVESILERLVAGESEAQILEANPRLVPADICAALQFAAETLRAGARDDQARATVRVPRTLLVGPFCTIPSPNP